LIKYRNNFLGHFDPNTLKAFKDTSKFSTLLKCLKSFQSIFLEILGHFEVPWNLNRDVVTRGGVSALVRTRAAEASDQLPAFEASDRSLNERQFSGHCLRMLEVFLTPLIRRKLDILRSGSKLADEDAWNSEDSTSSEHYRYKKVMWLSSIICMRWIGKKPTWEYIYIATEWKKLIGFYANCTTCTRAHMTHLHRTTCCSNDPKSDQWSSYGITITYFLGNEELTCDATLHIQQRTAASL
jgi:hypothetical protein